MSDRKGAIGQLSGKLQEVLGTPPGLKAYSPFPLAGLNQTDSPIGMPDNEVYWIENLLKTGNGEWRSMWDHGPALYTATGGKTIIKMSSFNITTSYYFIVFLSDGTAVQVNRDTGVVVTISAVVNTFYNGTNLPDCCPSGGQYLLISNNHVANAYWIWDGTILYSSGTLAPFVTLSSGGSGYASAPTVTAFGGSGTGATFVASVVNGSVVAVLTTNPGTGYKPSDIVQLQFSGGGSDAGAILVAVLSSATVDHLTLLAPGSGYTSPPTVVFSSGAAAATAFLTATSVASIAVGAGGAGYTTSPNVVIAGGGGSGATATATVNAGAVTSIVMTAAGSGYTSLPTVTLTGGAGTGATATATLAATSVGALSVTNHGSGYTSTPSITFTGGGGGSGASALAVLSSGSLSSVTVSNGGSGFTGTPLLTVLGGGGNSATATATVTSGVITSVTVTAGGAGYTSTPTIVVSAGLNNAASGSITLMPYGVSGGALENYLSRVWLVNLYRPGAQPTGGKMIATAPGSLIDVAISDGGVGYTSTDRYLRAQYTGIRQSNGYLYPFGDSSVSVISNVQTSSASATTTFNYQNTDPQTGTNYRDSILEYGRSVLFANQIGVYGLYGGAVTKISKKVERLFQNGVFPPTAGAVSPTSAVATLFDTKVYLINMTLKDYLGVTRTVMLMWNEADWFIASQSVSLKYITTETINSALNAWGTDGLALYPLFTVPSATLTKTVVSKLYGMDQPYYEKLASSFFAYGQSFTAGTNLVFNWSTNYGQGGFPTPVGTVTMPNGSVDFVAAATDDVNAPLLGFTFTSQTADFSVYNLVLTYQLFTYAGA